MWRAASGRRQKRVTSRGGATVVECAIVAPLVLLIVLGIIACGFGIFRYHQVEHLAEESVRWLSLRGPRYQARTGATRPGEDEILKEVIRPRATSLDLDRLDCQVTWDDEASTVTVLLEYEWVPKPKAQPLTFRSSCTSPVLQ